MVSVETVGFDVLTGEEKNTFDKLTKEYLAKIEMKLKDLSSIKVHLKEYHIEGARKKYSIHVKFIAPIKIFEASASDWDFARTLHKMFKNIEEEIENRFRPEDKNKRGV